MEKKVYLTGYNKELKEKNSLNKQKFKIVSNQDRG